MLSYAKHGKFPALIQAAQAESRRKKRPFRPNDIAVALIQLGRATVIEAFADQRDTGSFVLVDAVTGASVAGGVVTGTQTSIAKPAGRTFRLTRALLKQGVGADLGDDPASERELRRRADEVAILLRGAGVAIELDEHW